MTAQGLFAVGRKLFLPSSHLWLRATRQSATNSGRKFPWLVDIGLSSRKLQDIGDVSDISPANNKSMKGDNDGWFVQAGEEIMSIEWEGHIITSADELYHTVWETYSATSLIKAPISGVIDYTLHADMAKSSMDTELDEDTVLVRMRAERLTPSAAEPFMEEQEYETFVETLGRGKFQD